MTSDQPFPLLNWTRGGELEATGVRSEDGMDLLRTICARFPNRTTGSPGEHGQAEYLAGILRDAGATEVTLDPVPCLSTDFDVVEFRADGPAGPAFEAVPMAFSGSTPLAGITAPLRYFDDVELVDFSRPDLRGVILLLFGRFGDFTTVRYYRAALSAGVAGVVMLRDQEHATCWGLPPPAAGCGNLPVLNLSYASGLQLMKTGATTAFLRVRTRIEEVVGYNVVARLPANAEPLDDQVFLVSSHLDAPPVRPAAGDNAAGTTMAVAVMRTIARARRRRDLWFVGYTAEEHAFEGSLQFPQDHPAVVARCALQLYYDGHGAIVGRHELEVTGDETLAQFMQQVAADLGLSLDVMRQTIGLDPIILIGQQVPAVRAGRRPERTWHSLHDSPDDLAPQVLGAGIHLYAEALFRLTNCTTLPFPRQVSPEAQARGAARARQWTPRTLEEARRGVAAGLAP